MNYYCSHVIVLAVFEIIFGLTMAQSLEECKNVLFLNMLFKKDESYSGVDCQWQTFVTTLWKRFVAIRLNHPSWVTQWASNVGDETFRSSHQMYSIRKSVLRNFASFTGKHLHWSLFLRGPETLLKKYSKTDNFL